VGTIVVGIDGSDESKDALRWAVDEAKAHGAKVLALHAWQVPLAPAGITPVPRLDLVERVDDIREAAKALVAQVVEEVGGGSDVEIEARVVEGPPAPSLIEAAQDADLLVVGSRGHGGFTGLLLGSISQYCVTHAPCPVLVHRSRGE
jgi:nucleotide-binding universal stress UspA family protein